MTAWIQKEKPNSKKRAKHKFTGIVKRFMVGLGMLSLMLAFGAGDLRGQIALTTSPYTENFNSIGDGLSTGWSVRTGASASSRGSAASLNTSKRRWNLTTGEFRNVASSNGATSADDESTQESNTDRALAIRPTSSFGNSGAAFELEIANTIGKASFSLTFKHLMLDVQGRSQIWEVQYSIDGGSSWTNVGTSYTDPGIWGSTESTIDFTNSLDNVSSTVLIRIASLAASTGGGSRDTYGIDDFVLNWSTSDEDTAPAISSQSASSITNSTASFEADITSDGGQSISTRGFVYSLTSANTDPEIGGTGVTNVVASGTSTGAFTSTVSSLNPGTSYTFKAYATNSVGTSYTGSSQFFTLSNAPTSDVSSFSVASNGITQSSIDFEFSDASGANGYLILTQEGSVPSDIPSNGSSYDVGSTLGSSTVASFVTIVGGKIQANKLSANTSYGFKIIPFAWDGSNNATINYYTGESSTLSSSTFGDASPVKFNDLFINGESQLLSSIGWTAHSGAGTNSISISSESLSLSGYLSERTLSSVSVGSTGEDVSYNFGAISSGAVFTSALIKIEDVKETGDYFVHYRNSGGSFFVRLYAKSHGEGFVFGLGKGSEAATYETTERSLNITYLIVLKYEFVAGDDNDVVSLMVNPSLETTEPSASISISANSDASEIAQIAIRQGNSSNAPTFKIAGIRVTSSWTAINNNSTESNITGTEGWRLFSSPFSNLTLSSFLNPIWTQGATTGANTTDGSPNVYSFNETADNKDAFVSVTDLSATMTAGKGYAVYVFSDDNGPAVEGDAGFPKTLSANGTANSLPFSYSLTFTDYSKIADDGWNFVGNPSTSSLAWSNFARTNVDAPIYLWDDVGNGWKNSLDTTIVPFKGFFVKASASSPELATSASAKEISRITNSVIPKLAIKGSKDNMKTELSVILIDGASIGKDEYDAYALTPLSENYIQSIGVLDSSSFAMISLPLDLSEAFEIPVVLKSTLSGDITLDFSLSDFPQDWSVILRNNDSSEEFDLRSTSGLTHSVTVASKQIPALERMNNGAPVVQKAATDDSEYTIIINPATTTSVEPQLAPKTFALEQNFPNPFNPTTTIRFDVAQSSQITLQVFDVTGRMVETLVSGMMPTGTYSVNWDASAQSSGMYLLRMQTESGILTRKMTLLK